MGWGCQWLCIELIASSSLSSVACPAPALFFNLYIMLLCQTGKNAAGLQPLLLARCMLAASLPIAFPTGRLAIERETSDRNASSVRHSLQTDEGFWCQCTVERFVAPSAKFCTRRKFTCAAFSSSQLEDASFAAVVLFYIWGAPQGVKRIVGYCHPCRACACHLKYKCSGYVPRSRSALT